VHESSCLELPVSAAYMDLSRVCTTILVLTISLFLSSCVMVEFDDYVHKPTQKLRQSLLYFERNKARSIKGISGRQLAFLPNFKTFTESYVSSLRGELFIVSSLGQTTTVSKVVLLNVNTGVSREMAKDTNTVELKSIDETERQFGLLPVTKEDHQYFNDFNTADKLELTVTYSLGDGDAQSEIMVIELTPEKILLG